MLRCLLHLETRDINSSQGHGTPVKGLRGSERKMRGVANVFPISVVCIIEGFILQLSERISLEIKLYCS